MKTTLNKTLRIKIPFIIQNQIKLKSNKNQIKLKLNKNQIKLKSKYADKIKDKTK